MPTLPEGISLVKSSKGRGIAANRPLQPGDTIAVFDDPATTIAIPDSLHQGQTCSWCLTPSAAAATATATAASVRACTGCRAAAYCSAACQRAGWRAGHKAECAALRRVRDEGHAFLPTPVRALVQALTRPGFLAAVAEMEGHADGFRRDRKTWDDLELQAMAGLHYAGRETTERNMAGAIEIMCKLQVNSFNRLDADIWQTGLFLNPGLAMVNHSCVPNAFVQFVGRKAVLHASQEIKKDEEITISYIECMPYLVHRQDALKRRYHFECICPRCEGDLDVYQVCKEYPRLELNSFSLFPDQEKLRNPPISRSLHSDKTLQQVVKDIYPTCSPPLADSDLESKVKELKRRWKACEPLRQAELYAVDPISQVLTEANIYFGENEDYTYSLAISCFLALNCDPYRNPMPFAPQRVKGLSMIAKLLSNTASLCVSPEAIKSTSPIKTKIFEVLSKVDQTTLCQVLLLLVVKYGPAAHSTEWQIYCQATDMLNDIESLPGRQLEDSLAKALIKTPSGAEEVRFFESVVLNPIRQLSTFALDIMAFEFSP